jgi:glutathione S-transferase
MPSRGNEHEEIEIWLRDLLVCTKRSMSEAAISQLVTRRSGLVWPCAVGALYRLSTVPSSTPSLRRVFNKNMSKPVLGYWKTRGLAEPIRHMLTFLKVDFEDVTYEQGDGPDFSRECWVSVKQSLGLAFPDLPYFIDADVKLTESSAIIRHVARKYGPGLLGTSVDESAHADMMYCVVCELKDLFDICYSPSFETLKPGHILKAREGLAQIADWLVDKPFLAGAHLTYVDFMFIEVLQFIHALEPGTAASVSDVFVWYVNRFKELVSTPDFYTRPRLPFNGKEAFFGGMRKPKSKLH